MAQWSYYRKKRLVIVRITRRERSCEITKYLDIRFQIRKTNQINVQLKEYFGRTGCLVFTLSA